MNIAFIHPSVPQAEGSGATHSATKIITELCDRGHDVTVFCTKPFDDQLSRPYRMEPLHVRRDKLSNFSEQINRAIVDNVGQFEDFDLVHSYMMRSIQGVSTIGENTSAATVVTLNAYGGICPRNDLLYNNEDRCDQASFTRCLGCTARESIVRSNQEQNSIFGTAIRSGYRFQNRVRNYRKVRHGLANVEHIDRFQALSDPVKQSYSEFGFDKARIKVIPNMMDDQFLVDHTSDFSEPFKLLYVGALRKRKGADRLAELINRYRSKYHLDVRLTIVGSGVAKPHLTEQIEAFGLEDYITITGHIPYEELPSMYAAHDLFVYLGIWDEPFGRVFLESLGAGTPIFATDVGATEDIVGDAGMIVEDVGLDTIVETLHQTLMSNKLAEMSRETRSRVPNYKPELVVDQFEELYNEVVDNTRGQQQID